MTQFTDEVRDTVSPYKFGGSRRAAALYLASLDGCEDESTGDCTEWGLYVSRFGRNLLTIDSQGFVSAERFDTDLAACERFWDIADEYETAMSDFDAPAGYVSADTPDDNPLNTQTRYRVITAGGVAWYLIGYVCETYCNGWGDSEVFEDRSRVRAVMVGDDRPHTFDRDELEPISDDDYCSSCGQIGCGWGH